MKIVNQLNILVLIFMFVVLNGCGVAHVRMDTPSTDLENYESVIIGVVKVYSNEAAAKNNIPLQEKLKNWESSSRAKLEEFIKKNRYKLIESREETSGNILVVNLDVNVQYGNRALRWAVGFGAGKGGVSSVLTAKDFDTGEIKFRANADSDLAMGGAGGDIGNVLASNVEKLLIQFK